MIPNYLLGDVLSLDTETAVLGDRVIEIGISTFRNGELVNEWGMYVNPTVPIDPEASKVHNIYDKDVDSAPTFADIGWVIYNYINAADVIVAYNAAYDLEVLTKEFTRLGMRLPKKPMADPFIWYKHWNRYSKGKTLIKATETYGIPYVGAHRALNDATVTGKLLFKMAAIKNDFPKDVKSLITKQRKMVQDQFEDLQAYFIKVGKGPIDPPEYRYYD